MLKNLNFKNSFEEQKKFSLVGMSTNLLGYVFYVILTFFGMRPEIAVSLLYPIGAIFGYYGNQKFTFKYSGSQWSSTLRYFLAHLGGYLINIFLLYTLVTFLNLPHAIVQALSICIVAIYLYIILKLYVFRVDNK